MKATVDQPLSRGHKEPEATRSPLPGLLLVFTEGRPSCEPVPLEGGKLALGRGRVGRIVVDDDGMSRQHAQVTHDGEVWRVEDLGSRNGTAVDGERVRGTFRAAHPRVLRVGDTLFLFVDDLAPFETERVEVRAGVVVGPTLSRAWREIASIALGGDTLHIGGETGSGKEKAALHFHAAGPSAKGPFVPVNCAAIPHALAERLLFGAKRGAYSGADTDAEGYVQAADRGVLFLDEVAELDLAVQAKLLRVLESREVTPLGAARPQKVDVRICTAAHADLKKRVTEGKFREDLYFRVARPSVEIPPLRERREEIPYLVAAATTRDKAMHASLLEAALVRPWPGNVRELLVEVREATRVASADATSTQVEARHFAPGAGGSEARAAADGVERSPSGDDDDARRERERPTREAIVATLRTHGGNIARAARALVVHRTQLRRWMLRDGIDVAALGLEPGPAGDDD